MSVGDDPAEPAGTAPEVDAVRLLRSPASWITPLVLASVLITLMTLIYVGSVVDPTAHLHGLPVLVVNEDAGTTVSSTHIDIGAEIVAALDQSRPITSRLSIRTVTLVRAETQMNKDAAYAAMVIPPQFTSSLLAVYKPRDPGGRAPPLPTIQLLTNGRAGSIGVSLATAIAQPAVRQISDKIGRQLSTASPSNAANAAGRALRADPVTLAVVAYRPLPPHSALGLSAFYISLLSIMCGFLGATIVNSTLDAALGYANSEVGPKWRQRAPMRISRWQTLLAKWLMGTAIVPVLTGLLLVAAVAVLHMDAPDPVYLWLFISCAAVVIAVGTLVLFAALGTLGQLVAMLVFVYLALASSGGTIPLQALPPLLKFVAGFEPLRQILDGVRAILYFHSAGAAGLTRGFVMTAVGLVIWIVLGVAVTTWYDRRGLYRIEPELMAYVQRSVRAYPQRLEDPDPPPGS